MPESGNPAVENRQPASLAEAESALMQLAGLSWPAGAGAANKAEDRPDVEARYRTLVEQIPAVIFMAFLDEGVSEAYVSPHIETILGFTQEQWLNDPVRWYQQIHPGDRDRWSVEASLLVLSGQALRSVYRVIARDGHVVWFHCEVKMVLREDGRPWFVHGTGFDITDLKEAEQALREAHRDLDERVRQRTAELKAANIGLEIEIAERQRAESQLARKAEELARSNADLEQFAYSACHDLQEPLRNIALHSQWLKKRYRGKLDANAEECIDILNEGAQRIGIMLNDLLTYTRAADTAEEIDEPVDANHAFAKALEDLESMIRDNEAVITHDPLPAIRIRQVHLQQLFQNLVSNAIKYRGIEPPHVHVSTLALNGCCTFSVKDDGIGIAPEYHEQIFGIFKRLHDRDKYTGTGIGLAICKRIVERYGGRIWVESEANQGAAFFFTVPGGGG
ncbi:MAG: ATP-binding protein [Bryobacteraceae bacterium]